MGYNDWEDGFHPRVFWLLTDRYARDKRKRRLCTSRRGVLRLLLAPSQPRPSNGILVALMFMNSTLVSSGRLAM